MVRVLKMVVMVVILVIVVIMLILKSGCRDYVSGYFATVGGIWFLNVSTTIAKGNRCVRM